MTAIDVDKRWRLLIDGEWVEPGDGTYEIIDPNPTKTVGYAPEATADQARDAARAAKTALPGWRALSRAERGSHLSKLAALVAERSPDWVATVQAETDATINIAE